MSEETEWEFKGLPGYIYHVSKGDQLYVLYDQTQAVNLCTELRRLDSLVERLKEKYKSALELSEIRIKEIQVLKQR